MAELLLLSVYNNKRPPYWRTKVSKNRNIRNKLGSVPCTMLHINLKYSSVVHRQSDSLVSRHDFYTSSSLILFALSLQFSRRLLDGVCTLFFHFKLRLYKTLVNISTRGRVGPGKVSK